MPEVVALDLPPGQGFVDALRAVWDTGDAAAPLDPRLPPPAARALLAVLRPTRVVASDGEITRLPDGAGTDEGDALVIGTSGSTGTPRAAVLTHNALQASASATTARLGVQPDRHRWLACLPFAHIGGLSVVTRALLTGTPFTVLPRFDAERVEEAGRRGGATHVSLVPTALRRVDTAVFERVVLGGAAPPTGLGQNIVTAYGLTETGSGVVYDGVPLDGVEVAIGTGSEGGGEPGEILLRGPQLLRAYRDGTDPELPGPDGRGGWLATGDGGRFGDDGRLQVDGRLSEVVVTGGEKVWPATVEACLVSHPAVNEVAVWKRADPEWGERVVAWVVAHDPASPPALEDLRHHVASHLPAWAAPKELVLTETLPRTNSGKVRRSHLT